MRNKKKLAFTFLALSLSYFVHLPAITPTPDYPNFKDNPYLDERMRASMAPYLLPLDHPLRATLDSIFSQTRVIQDERSLADAGFTIIAGPMPRSYVIVARHPQIPGYVFKLYLDNEVRTRQDVPHWVGLINRCVGAAGIRKIIECKHIRNFVVPDKWLYILPVYPLSNVMNPEPFILMETDMELESDEVTKLKWRTIVTRKHLDELYSILKSGYGGSGAISLANNVPYTKQGKFAFTDTEKPRHVLKLKKVKLYLSEEMQRYWDSLINK